MNWLNLKEIKQLEAIKKESANSPVLIFKHSTRCSISATSLARLERNWNESQSKGIRPYYLDLISFRSISSQIEKDYSIEHQSPQALLIKDGKCIFDSSHMAISFDEIIRHA